MGSSAKKKKEKKKDFAKPKLKVGKARPKNTNATDTSFTARSIILKQQSLSESGRDSNTLFKHNLSLLSSKSDQQRRDALAYLTTTVHASGAAALPVPAEAVVAKAQPLVLDSSASVRSQLLKLLRALPSRDVAAAVEQLLLYTRAGMAHLSTEIRISSLDVLDWLLDSNGEAAVSVPGGWVKTLRAFQNLLSWQQHSAPGTGVSAGGGAGKWTSATPGKTNVSSSNKLLVHQLTSLSKLLTAGLTPSPTDPSFLADFAASVFPLRHALAHAMPRKSNPYGYLNLFGAPRDAEGEVYDTPEERTRVFEELALHEVFGKGVAEAKKEGGEVGRAASAVDKALRLAIRSEEG